MNVDVQIKLPPNTAARSIICDIKTRHLKVLIKGQEEPIMDGELYERVKVDDSFWNIEDKEFLNINLEKMEEKIAKMAGDSLSGSSSSGGPNASTMGFDMVFHADAINGQAGETQSKQDD